MQKFKFKIFGIRRKKMVFGSVAYFLISLREVAGHWASELKTFYNHTTDAVAKFRRLERFVLYWEKITELNFLQKIGVAGKG